MAKFQFKILKNNKNSGARAGLIKTKRGNIQTPYLVTVATSASVRALDSHDLISLGAQCTLANTYHLHLRPGDERIRKLGGLHKFMNFDKPIFTDSGGFQAFSLGYGMEHNINKLGNIFAGPNKKGKTAREKKEKLARVDDNGVHFRSVYDGTKYFMDAKKSMKIQSNLGSDIIMAFDECTSPLSDYEYTRKALLRTHRWAAASLKYHDKKQALYGIVQGGWFKKLRTRSAEFINSLPFEGIAIGGSLGKSKKDMHKILEWVVPMLDKRPRHLLGIGDIDDLFECVSRGIDTFDCVAPTRIARRGNLYILPESGGSLKNKFRINIKAAVHKDDKEAVDENCGCPTCRNYSRAYLRHLYRVNELTYFRLASVHNIHFMLRLMERIRKSILNDSFDKLKRKWLKKK
ncbi:tRNA guanosine(34) transglycosylase Tgt [Candidatus Woesearchaeota archaeon]|nr:tRNA guanosine(34) transglycosylase Tgt [Candidatus Woesearchaeota archaeon]